MRIARKLELPDRILKMAILGRTGSGKTNTAISWAEQMITAGLPVAIIDPQGDWWGLRSEFEIVILGGEHADLPLEPTGGTIAADFVINERLPILLDLFSMGEGEMVRFATDFARQLWTHNRSALHVFLDEADLFAPQKSPGADKAKCLGAWQNVCRRGRSRGIGLTMITQRPAVLNKDLLTQADPVVLHNMTAPQDLGAIDSYLDFHGIPKAARRTLTSQISKLAHGEKHGRSEIMVISPGELEITPTKFAALKRKSFDSGKSPSRHAATQAPRKLADVDLSALRKSMADTIERAKQQDPKLLQYRIRELEKQIAKGMNDTAAVKAQPDVASKACERMVSEMRKAADSINKTLGRALQRMEKASIKNGAGAPKLARTTVVTKGTETGRAHLLEDRDRSAMSQRIHGYLSQAGRPLSRKQLAALCGVASSNGNFSNRLGELVRSHTISKTAGGYQCNEFVPSQLATGDELIELVLNKTGGIKYEILAFIHSAATPVARAAIAEACGVASSNGNFSNRLGELKRHGIVTKTSQGYQINPDIYI